MKHKVISFFLLPIDTLSFEMMDDDPKPVPPTRVASMRDKNGSNSEKDKKKGWFGRKNQGKPVCVCVSQRA